MQTNFFVLGGLLTLTVPASALASTSVLPDAVIGGQAFSYPYNISNYIGESIPDIGPSWSPGTYTTPDGGASFSAGYTPAPFVSVSVTGNPNNAPSAQSDIEYWAEIVGPEDSRVPLDFSYTINATNYGASAALGQTFGQAIASFAGISPGILAGYYNDVEQVGSFSTSGVFTQYYYTDTPLEITIDVQAGVGGVGGSSSLLLDPTVSIDPSFGQSGYSLIFSSGIGNSEGAVPEPSTWALMVAGFGMIGFAARHRGNVTYA